MTKYKKISESEVPADFFTVEFKPISEETQKRLKIAAEIANERIERNNRIYASSNAHAGGYPVSSNSGIVGHTKKKVR